MDGQSPAFQEIARELERGLEARPSTIPPALDLSVLRAEAPAAPATDTLRPNALRVSPEQRERSLLRFGVGVTVVGLLAAVSVLAMQRASQGDGVAIAAGTPALFEPATDERALGPEGSRQAEPRDLYTPPAVAAPDGGADAGAGREAPAPAPLLAGPPRTPDPGWPRGAAPEAAVPTGAVGERPVVASDSFGEVPVVESASASPASIYDEPEGGAGGAVPAGPPAAFDAALASAAVGAAAARASGCGDGAHGGAAVVSITIVPSGRVTQVVLDASSTLAGTSVGACIAQAMRSAAIAPFIGGPVTVQRTVRVR